MIGLELFDILKSRAGITVGDAEAVLFAKNGGHAGDVTVYLTAENKVYTDQSLKAYALKGG